MVPAHLAFCLYYLYVASALHIPIREGVILSLGVNFNVQPTPTLDLPEDAETAFAALSVKDYGQVEVIRPFAPILLSNKGEKEVSEEAEEYTTFLPEIKSNNESEEGNETTSFVAISETEEIDKNMKSVTPVLDFPNETVQLSPHEYRNAESIHSVATTLEVPKTSEPFTALSSSETENAVAPTLDISQEIETFIPLTADLKTFDVQNPGAVEPTQIQEDFFTEEPVFVPLAAKYRDLDDNIKETMEAIKPTPVPKATANVETTGVMDFTLP